MRVSFSNLGTKVKKEGGFFRFLQWGFAWVLFSFISFTLA